MIKYLSLLATTFYITNTSIAQFSEQIPFVWDGDQILSRMIMDTDGDGDLDIITTNNYTGPRLIENKGDNTFHYPVYLSDIESGYEELVQMDVDGDGDHDFFSRNNSENHIALFENLGDNNFSENVFYDIGASFVSNLMVHDIDGDGDLDLSVTELTTHLLIFYNEGDGTFTSENIDIGTSCSEREMLDADGDGDLDLIYHNYSSYQIDYRVNDAGVFAPAINIGSVYIGNSLETMDADGDGDQDILYTKSGQDKVYLIANDGTGTFSSAVTLITHDEINMLINSTVDFDNDGNLDILIQTMDSDLTIYWSKNLGDGLFAETEELLKTTSYEALPRADFDADGDLDFLQSKSYADLIFYENLGGGELADYRYFSETTVGTGDITTADIDLDGDIDVISVTADDGKVGWVENLGGSEFSRLHNLNSSFIEPEQIIAVDIDGDTYPEILVIDNSLDKVFMFQNLGDGTFGPQTEVCEFIHYPTSILAGDWDDDGDNDIMVAAHLHYGLFLYENIGGVLSAEEIIIYDEAWDMYDLENADLDGDGDLDISFVAHIDNKIMMLENTGDLTFTTHIVAEDLIDSRRMKLYDIDNDGDMDITYSSDTETKLMWIENLGGGDFSAPVFMAEIQNGPWQYNLGDLNNDGLVDVLTIDMFEETMIWLKNEGDLEFAEPVTLMENANHLSTIIIDLDADGDNDLIYSEQIGSRFGWFTNKKAPNGISENNPSDLVVYPNPFSDFTTITIPKAISSNYSIVIHNMLGEEVYRVENLSGIAHQIEQNDLGKGLFMITLLDSNLEPISTTKILSK